MGKSKESSEKATSKSVSNKELKKIVLDLGADLVDTLDSIHNAILTTRKEIKSLQDSMGVCKPDTEKTDSLKTEELPDTDKEDEGHDHYSAYIG